MSYTDLVDWMFNLERFGIKLGLDNMREFLDRIGNPHHEFRSIHVTGTNGKGSVCTFLADVLNAHGFRVGLYTSPHLVDFRERIKVDGQDIPEEAVVRIGEELRSEMVSMAKEGTEKQLTFFEFTTGLAFRYFAEEHVDIVVAEVGMGGRLDATNVIEPDVSVITRIGLEHTDYLGRTIPEIAFEKAGIIKRGAPVVTCERDPAILGIFGKKCDEFEVPLVRIELDFSVDCIRQTLSGTSFNYSGKGEMMGLETVLIGGYQAENAAAAIACLECLTEKGDNITEEEIRKGLTNARWPGRMQIVQREPLLIFDGGHNPDGVRMAILTLEALGTLPMTFVVGCMNDKDAREIVRTMAPHASKIIATQVNNKRALPADTLYEIVKEEFKGHSSVSMTSSRGIEMALESTLGKGVCVIGSLYLVGEAIQWKEKNVRE
ncbi:MAG: bifunctional folylpolyglutamate synthase/dihydrofolate synthase [Thermoplasmata archaeon]|nr:bifunctional folylpolyglutamate synthase/dihydrofolate synthase [Thermoplasmata archaeon]